MVEFFLGLVGNFFGIASFNLANKQAKSEVISSLRHAIRLTESHINKTRIGEFGAIGFSDMESHELADAWSRVANAIRPFDRKLARTFEDKSDYWINPHGFRHDIQNGERKLQYGIMLVEVKKELDKIENGRI